MKIIKITKKPWYLRILGIEHWWCDVEFSQNDIRRYSVWANVSSPNANSFLRDLKRQVFEVPEILVGKEL